MYENVIAVGKWMLVEFFL